MHSFVTSKNAQWPRLIWPTLYISSLSWAVCWRCRSSKLLPAETASFLSDVLFSEPPYTTRRDTLNWVVLWS